MELCSTCAIILYTHIFPRSREINKKNLYKLFKLNLSTYYKRIKRSNDTLHFPTKNHKAGSKSCLALIIRVCAYIVRRRLFLFSFGFPSDSRQHRRSRPYPS